MMQKSWVSILGYDDHCQKTRSSRGNKRMHQLVLILLALFATNTLANKAANPKDDPLGEVVDEHEFDEPGTTSDFGFVPILPFTEKDQRTRERLNEKYPTYEQLNL